VSEILRIPVDRELGERVHWLINVRWLGLLLAVVLVLVANYSLGIHLPLGALWIVLGIVLALNLAFWVIAHRLMGHTAPNETYAALLHIQILSDIVALTVLLHFTGGLENPFSAYYVLLVVIGGVLTTRRAGYVYVLVSSVLWLALLLSEASGLLPHYNISGYRLAIRHAQPVHIASSFFVLLSLNAVVAFFSSGIIAHLREGERQLYEVNRSCVARARELTTLNKRLRELDRSRTLFIRLVTHELRAPVAAIQSYLRLILDGYVPAERMTEIITRAEQRSRDQLDLISDLLDLARAQDPRDTTPPSPVDIAQVLYDVLDLLHVRAESKLLKLSVQVAPDLPAVLAAQPQIKQIWTNLISNAIKYTPEEGSVWIALNLEGDMVRGTVRDTGIGISPEEQAHIFETFYRTESAKATSPQGTGVGLSIVKGILDRYHGRVWIESAQGEGSTFFFELPRAP